MKKSFSWILVCILFSMAACKVLHKEDLTQVSAITGKEMEESTIEKKTEGEEKTLKKDLEEIFLEKPKKQAVKARESSSEKTRQIIQEKELENPDGEKIENIETMEEEISQAAEPVGQKEEEEKEEEDEKDIEIEEEEKGFIFKPYYSADIGNQGIFPDSDAATEEGWRISEMDDPSEYLGFTPRGWEVYPVWYYHSPEEAEVFYTLNFYH